ncbi:MAG TPA: ankyrin repeat domain-containing protein [Bryobacteraceae bacterium]|nr:ankyrin repeat domain-containing protein [Bryobacteraceae bacterium]
MRISFLSLAMALVGAISLTTVCHAQGTPDFTPPTALIRAIMQGNSVEAKRLLSAGANPNEGLMIGGTPLLLAIMQGQFDTARALIQKGADVKALDRAGSTTLMWATANEIGDAAFVKELLALGVDPTIKNKLGDDALTWAMRRGHTPVVEVLKQHGMSPNTMIRTAVERSIALLQKSGPEFSKGATCASCHHQSLPQMAYGHARERGYAVDATVSEQQVKAVIAMYRPVREMMLAGKENLPDPPITVGYALLGLAAEGYKPDSTTEAMAHLIGLQQNEDGSFRVLPARPPMESTRVTGTALSIRALQLYGKDADERIRRATHWLRSVKPATNEERTMQLLGLAWAKAAGPEAKAAVKGLISEQRADGGWGQLANLESDAYATGQALVALQASGIAPSHPAFQRGVAFLLRTQRPDGSWLVRSRSFPFQPYKETGFPYGKDQWISAAGTSWAAMALSLADTPQTPGPQISQVR